MTFKDRHLLEALPGLMEAVARDIAKLETALAEPGLYSRDRARYDKAAALLAELQRRQTENEETWLRLEMLREETEG
jgi:ATP-binding cassette subfamily F protein uup